MYRKNSRLVYLKFWDIFNDKDIQLTMTIFITALSIYLDSRGIHQYLPFSPNGVLNVIPIEGDEESEDGEEHDGVGCENEATGSTSDLGKGLREIIKCGLRLITDHGGGGGGVGSQGGGDSAAVRGGCAGGWGWTHGYRGSGENDGQGEGWYDDAGGEEVCQLPAGIAGAVIAVTPGQHAGDGTEQVEDDDCEGVPVTAT